MYLELREVQKYYGEGENRIQVLKGVNGKIEKGEICVMLGPSGSGKSTLLNLIGGIETIDSGKIIVDSIDISTLSKAKLGTYRNKYPNQLSGGQQQRTAIGRALAKNPKLLLCDEPTGALDYYTSKDILELLEQINHDYGTTILIVTHNDAISKMAQRILRLHDGQIISNSLNSSRITAKKLEW